MARSPSAAAVFPIDYGLYPKPEENPRTIRTLITLEAATAYTVSLGTLVDQEALSNIQTIKIDNSSGANPVTVRAGKTGDTITCPAYTQGYYPFLFGDDSQIQVTRADAGLITLWLINMPMPTAQWSTVASGGSIVIDPTTIAALIVALEQCQTATASNVAMTAASVALLAANASRKAATFYNDGPAVVYVQVGAAASATSFIIAMQPQSYFELPRPCYVGAVNAFGAVGNTVRVVEFS